jgi:hypothetical protein
VVVCVLRMIYTHVSSSPAPLQILRSSLHSHRSAAPAFANRKEGTRPGTMPQRGVEFYRASKKATTVRKFDACMASVH